MTWEIKATITEWGGPITLATFASEADAIRAFYDGAELNRLFELALELDEYADALAIFHNGVEIAWH